MQTTAFSTQALAYLGDAVFELCAREYLISNKNYAEKDLAKKAKAIVSAKAQSVIYHEIFESLSEEEQNILRRGRNLNPLSRARNMKMSDYRHATGLEALFGFLHSEGRTERLKEVFEICLTKL